MAGWVDAGMGGRCVRYGRIAGWRDGHKGGVKGPLLMKQKKKEKNLLRNLHRRRKKFYFVLFMM